MVKFAYVCKDEPTPGEEHLDATHPQTMFYLRKFLLESRPKIIVEAGSFLGGFATMAADIASVWGGTVITTDPAHHGNWYAHNFRDNLFYLQDDFVAIREEFPQVIGHVGFAYIDSGAAFQAPVECHTRFLHYSLAREWLGDKGVIVVDDTNSEWEGVEEIRAEATTNLVDVGRGLSVRQCP